MRWFLPLLSALTACVTDAELEAALDRDRDGYLPVQAGGDDCDESRASINPGAQEVCGDGIDNDCDGIVDDDGMNSRTFFRDGDGDGFGDETEPTVSACAPPEGFASNPGDCDDADPAMNPAAEDLCDGRDNDCDEVVDDDALLVLRYPDVDEDGFGVESGGVYACEDLPGYSIYTGDCDDSDPTVSPVAEDTCNGDDDNCNGLVDEDAVNLLRFRDADGDQFGTDADTVEACQDVPGYVLVPGDCDDADPATNPAALDGCDGVDRDCNGAVDDDAIDQTWYLDDDGDGFGQDGVAVAACDTIPGYSLTPGDCDDSTAGISPSVPDDCDATDNNCNGIIDEDAVVTLFYADVDADGSGDAQSSVEACVAPPGFVSAPGDCDDSNATIRPGSLDPCDGVDQDCDDAIDENAEFTIWFQDADGDGLGTSDTSTSTCDGAPPGMVSQAGDCDDSDASLTVPTWFLDGDGDGSGTVSMSMTACTAPAGFVSSNDDCDDTNASVAPTQLEICNNHLDDDCDPLTDCRIVNTYSISDLPILLELPDDVSDLGVFPDVLGTGPGTWVYKRDQTDWFFASSLHFPFDAADTPLPCASRPQPVRDFTGDGLPDLYCRGIGLPFRVLVLESGTLEQWTTIELPTAANTVALPMESTNEGPGTWLQTGSELRFYPRTGATVVPEDGFLQSLPCAGPSNVFELSGSPDLIVTSCNTGNSATAFAYPADQLLTVNDPFDAMWTMITPPNSNGGYSPVYLTGDSAGSMFWGASLTFIFDPELISDFKIQLFEQPFTEEPGATALLDPPAGTVSNGFPVGDLDGDGSVDWLVDTEGIRLDIAYGGPEVVSLANTSTVILSGFDQMMDPYLSLYPHDGNGDGYDDLAIELQRDDGSRAIHVLYGSGQ